MHKVEVKAEGETLGRKLKHRVRESVRVEAEGEEEERKRGWCTDIG